MVMKWLWNDYEMVIKWLWNGYEMVMKWLWNGYEMVMKWLWNGYEMVMKWLWNGYELDTFEMKHRLKLRRYSSFTNKKMCFKFVYSFSFLNGSIWIIYWYKKRYLGPIVIFILIRSYNNYTNPVRRLTYSMFGRFYFHWA